MITKGCENQPDIYLTFDDGPDPRFTPRLLDILDLFQIRASFFLLGQACERFPELVRRISEAGHTVGNHTYTHCHPWAVSARRARDEVRRAQEVIAEACGKAPKLFRPPYGRRRAVMIEEARALGMETVLWTRSAIDWGLMAEIDSIGHRLSRASAGDILLCHDAPMVKNKPDLTLIVLPGFIEQCHRRKLRFAGLDHLLARRAAEGSISQAQSV
jgi:peptidoglycan/xylan/chitin deacetylase (PgdA/CDA1 family)